MSIARVAQSRVGVLGSGVVGQQLALCFSGCGHDVMIGTRDPNKPELEAICIAWVKLIGVRGSVDHGFKLLAG